MLHCQRLLGEGQENSRTAGENEATWFGFRDQLRTQAAVILNPYVACLGGTTQYVKVASMTDVHGVVMSPHGQQQVHTHLDCGVPNVIMTEFYPAQYDAKIYEEFQYPIMPNSDGTVSPSEYQAPESTLTLIW